MMLGEAMATIKTRTAITGQICAERLTRSGVMLDQTMQAVQRAEEFLCSLGVTPMVRYTAFGLVAGYTVYYILRYPQIPFGGFIRSIFSSVGSTSSSSSYTEVSNSNSSINNNNTTMASPSLLPNTFPVISNPGLSSSYTPINSSITITRSLDDIIGELQELRDLRAKRDGIVKQDVSTISLDSLNTKLEASENTHIKALDSANVNPAMTEVSASINTSSLNNNFSFKENSSGDSDKISFEGHNPKLEVLGDEHLKPLEEVHESMIKIRNGAEITAQLLVEKLKKSEVVLEQTIEATRRHESLYLRGEEFVRSLGPRRLVTYTAFGLVTGYTIYYILRYQQIPLGGFIRGLFSSTGSTASQIGTSNVSPTFNVNISQPTLPISMPHTPYTSLANADTFATALETFCIRHPIISGMAGIAIMGILKWKTKR